ncbi:hypothetical protein CYMTET_17356 [Cymbomonas tetramitiformis]|uniref:Uncharacterized protein n=2 Tax=Cymbomonas tetramitiformis TaxID=36881 RepID=A0AAE0GAT8_9CHLO|nr:hypothetical protein CYMTET_17356 [Cymbomonas tetramitiformis]
MLCFYRQKRIILGGTEQYVWSNQLAYEHLHRRWHLTDAPATWWFHGARALDSSAHQLVRPLFVEGSDPTKLSSILTRLDAEEAQHMIVCGVCRPFKRELYWWGIYEIFQRLLQSSVVVLVCLVARDYDVLFSLVVAFTSLLVQARMLPYKEPADNWLQILVLYNLCMVYTVFLAEEYLIEEQNGSDIAGGFLLMLQASLTTMVAAGLIYLNFPFVLSTAQQARSKGNTMIKKLVRVDNRKPKTAADGAVNAAASCQHEPSCHVGVVASGAGHQDTLASLKIAKTRSDMASDLKVVDKWQGNPSYEP